MKKILFKTQQFPLLSETFISSHIIMAIEQGYEVRLLVKELKSFEDSVHSDLLKKHDIGKKVIIEDYKIPVNKFVRSLKALVILLKNWTNFPKIVNYIKFKKRFSLTWIYEFEFYSQLKDIDIIHVHYGTNIHPLDILKKTGLLNGQLIVSFHGHDAFFPINGFIPNNGYYSHLFEKNNLIIANTPFLSNQLINLGCPKDIIKCVPAFVDTTYFYSRKNFKEPNDIINLISVGRLEKIKGHEFGILAVKKLVEEGYKVQFTIIGEGKYKELLIELIRSTHLELNVKLVGRKDHKAIREEFWKSDIFLMTSVTVEEQIQETQGLVTLEAQACGLPVVAFNSGGVKYTVRNGETGYLCQEKDIEEFSSSIKRLILDKQLINQFGVNAERFIQEEFSKKVISAKWKDIYN